MARAEPRPDCFRPDACRTTSSCCSASPGASRSGIDLGYTGGSRKGVHAMPVLPNFYALHQWLRELRRHQTGTLLALDSVISDDEAVLVDR